MTHKELLTKALVELRSARAELEAWHEPIAVVGLGCRFPGGADSPDAFWRVLRDGVDTVSEIPPDRWPVDALYDPDPHTPGRTYVRHGAFLDGVDRFDPYFFGISPREARAMDPQQRLLLEVAWEALEHAGVAPDRLAGSQTGVFVGMHSQSNDYGYLQTADLRRIDPYTGIGTAHNVVSGRLSYVLDLRGPSVVVDTACSSSLVAVHYACRSLRERESDLALAAGVNLMLTPVFTLMTSQGPGRAPDGRCKTFDAAADGVVSGEGCGVAVLQRLADALAGGQRILAVIRGSAVKQDGRSTGLTAPNGAAQEAVIRAALADAGRAPADVGLVEAHGTGTPLGDPIEMEALAAVIGTARPAGEPCLVGSVKTNLGHLEGAAGIAGLIKVVLALEHGEVPPHLHLRAVNPNVSLADGRLEIPTGVRAWPPGTARVAGVSSFGWSGTNAHVVLEEPEGPAPPPAQAPPPERGTHVLTLSARSEPALRELAGRFARALAGLPAEDLPDVCFTANAGRARLEERLAVTGASPDALRAPLAEFAAGERPRRLLRGTAERRPRIAFLFTGQGAQRIGMGRGLYDTEPVFRAAFERVDRALAEHLPRPLTALVYPDAGEPSPLDETALTQPAMFALQYALAELWAAWGVQPAAVLGHSVGEFAAAYVAGVLDVEQAARLVAARGRAMQDHCPAGAMAAVFAGEEEVRRELPASVAVASVNGPAETVVSGAAAAVGEVVARFAARGVRARALSVTRAFHSPLVDPALPALEAAAAALDVKAPRLAFVSGLTGAAAGAAVLADPTYWRRQAREPVRFRDAVACLRELGCDAFVELGPHPTLVAIAQRLVEDHGVAWMSSLRAGRPDGETMLEALGALHVRGASVDWEGVDRGRPRRRVALPTYPFQRERHWLEEPDESVPVTVGAATPRHPLVGPPLCSAHGERIYAGSAGLRAHPALGDHRIRGTAVLPAAAVCELALAVADEDAELRDLRLLRPLVLADEPVPLQAIVGRAAGDGTPFELHAHVGGRWAVHARGTLAAPAAPPAGEPLAAARARCAEALPVEAFYDRLRAAGLEYGPGFRAVAEVWRGDGEALARLRAGASAQALLDAGLQTCLAAAGLPGDPASTPVPTRIGGVRVLAGGGSAAWSHARVNGTGETRVTLLDAAGAPVAELTGLRSQPLGGQELGAAPAWHRVAWRGAPAPAAPAPEGRWLVAGDAGKELADRLRAGGATVVADGDMEALAGAVYVAGGAVAPEAACREAGELLGALARAGTAARVWLVTHGVQRVEDGDPPPALGGAPLWGLGAVAALEHPELRCTRVDLGGGAGADGLLAELGRDDGENAVALRGERRSAQRLVAEETGTANARLVPDASGVIERLRPAPAPRPAPGTGEVEIEVAATGLTFRDVLIALGVYPGAGDALGTECAGRVTAVGAGVTAVAPGDEVLAIAPACFARYALTDARLVAPKPADWSFATAAGVPVAFVTAQLALERLVGLAPGRRVLIHAAAGGVGLAAVQLAQRLGAEVFATASPAKWPELRARGVPHVMSSRTPDFADAVLAATAGRGVDVVLNSLADELAERTLAVVAPGGCFVELGKRGVPDAEEAARRRPDVRHVTCDLAAVVRDAPGLVAEVLADVLRALAAGELAPLPTRELPVADAAHAFRHMAQGRHVGKLVLTQPRPVRPDGTYLVTGGTGALGRRVGRWLAEQGAGAVVLASRRAPDDELRAALADGRCVARQADVASEAELTALLNEIRATLPPLRGVIHAAGVLDDAVLIRQDWQRAMQVLAPKVAGAWNLHVATRDDPLEFFVLFSSAAGVLGSPGQAAYAAANAYQDALADLRRAEGRPALAVDWGPWAETGMAAGVVGTAAIRPLDALGALGRLLAGEAGQVVVAAPGFVTGGGGARPILRELAADAAERPVPRAELAERLEQAPPAARLGLALEELAALAARALDFDAARRLPADQPLAELGFDSLMAVEMRNALAESIGRPLPATLLFDHPTLGALAAHLVTDVLGLGSAAPATNGEVVTDEVEARVRELTDEEAAALLGDRLAQLDPEGAA